MSPSTSGARFSIVVFDSRVRWSMGRSARGGLAASIIELNLKAISINARALYEEIAEIRTSISNVEGIKLGKGKSN